MANEIRKLGVNLFTLMQNSGLSHEEIANQLGHSVRDLHRILEGRLLLDPSDLNNISTLFSITKHEFLNFNSDKIAPGLEYRKEFSNPDNLDLILDLLDDFVELKEEVELQ